MHKHCANYFPAVALVGLAAEAIAPASFLGERVAIPPAAAFAGLYGLEGEAPAAAALVRAASLSAATAAEAAAEKAACAGLAA
jgi:hypothetical protein